MDNSNTFNLHNLFFEPKSLWKFFIRHKMFYYSDSYSLPLKDMHQSFKDYINTYNLYGLALTKQLDSFFNHYILKDFDRDCYHIHEYTQNKIDGILISEYGLYKKNTKYASIKGFKDKNSNWLIFVSRLKYYLDAFSNNQIKVKDKLENGLVVYETGLRTIEVFTSELNYNELYEYLNFVLQEFENFDPDKNKNQSSGSKIKNPFKDKKTNDLFNYIVDKWDYHRGQKWADIYTIIKDLYEYKTPEPKDYQKYIILRYGYTGKFQYDIISKKNENVLSELIDEFSKL